MPTRGPRERFLHNLAAALLTGDWTANLLRKRLRLATGETFKWIPPLTGRVLKRFPNKPDFDRLLEFVTDDEGFQQACSWNSLPVWTIFVEPQTMTSPPAAAGPVERPHIATECALAEWLDISLGKLLWLADTGGRNRQHPAGPLRPYRYRWLAKPGGRSRLIEMPIPKLKRIQKTILAEILEHIPPHPAAHGFRAGHSVVTNAGLHCAKAVVIRFDLADFFPSVSSTRVYRTFRTFGYPTRVARLLTGLCTNCLPYDIWQSRPFAEVAEPDHIGWARLSSRHLPQGAPTSPALANLACFRLDGRLSRLAAAIGTDYTRYADDLTFSGNDKLARGSKRFATLVASIVAEEGFKLNPIKTRTMTRSSRQLVTGVVVNVKTNVRRVDFDRLKATLLNCVRRGPTSQNREEHTDFRAHLSGRIAQLAAINPLRARKLWILFDRIAWSSATQPSEP